MEPLPDEQKVKLMEFAVEPLNNEQKVKIMELAVESLKEEGICFSAAPDSCMDRYKKMIDLIVNYGPDDQSSD